MLHTANNTVTVSEHQKHVHCVKISKAAGEYNETPFLQLSFNNALFLRGGRFEFWKVLTVCFNNTMNSIITKGIKECFIPHWNDSFYFLSNNIIEPFSLKFFTLKNVITIRNISCDSVVENCVISTDVVGSIPREHTYWQKNYNLNALNAL